MKILFANSFYTPEIGGGAELTLHRLASGLAQQGHAVSAFTTGETEKVDVIDGVTVYRFPIDNTFRKLDRNLPARPARALWQVRDMFSAAMAKRFERVMQTVRPDVVQFHNLSGLTRSLWAVPKKLGVPSVQVLHDLYLICPSSSMFKNGDSCRTRCLGCRLLRRSFATASRDVDVLVGVSRYVLDKVAGEGLFPQSDQRVIYNGQSLAGPCPLVGGSLPRFGYIGALAPHKGIRWLIEQFTDRHGELVIAGVGAVGYVEELKQLALGKRVTFVGHVPSAEFFPTIDVGIVPSIWNETLAGTAIECSARGRAAIVSSRGGLPEIVRDGETGILVDPDRPDSLGEAMTKLANDPALMRRMANAGSSAVVRFTDVARFTNEYLSLYDQLVGQSVTLPL